jgi:hypothetical protein
MFLDMVCVFFARVFFWESIMPFSSFESLHIIVVGLSPPVASARDSLLHPKATAKKNIRSRIRIVNSSGDDIASPRVSDSRFRRSYPTTCTHAVQFLGQAAYIVFRDNTPKACRQEQLSIQYPSKKFDSRQHKKNNAFQHSIGTVAQNKQ